MNQKKLKELIKHHELDKYEDEIIKNLRETISLKKTREDDYGSVGNSRVGGKPDLPEGTDWPYTEAGDCMTFLAQLNLEELQKQTPNELFPEKGILYFFIGVDEPAFNIEHKVIFVENYSNLKCTTPHETPILEKEQEVEFSPYQLTTENSFDMRMDAWIYDLEEEDIDDIFSDLMYDFRLKDEIGYMLGYAHSQHDDDEIEAALMLLTGKEYDYYPEHAKKEIAEHLGSELKMEEEIEKMAMLLMLDSDDELGFCWWDCGCLHFFIREEDLKNRNFDKTYLSLYSS